MGLMEIVSFTDPCEEHFHIFMPSSFPLKVVKGGLWILQTTQRLMRSPLFKWINRRQESCWQSYAGPQSEMTAGWANGTGGGWGLTGRPSRWWSPLSLPSFLPLLLFSLISVDQNRLGDICSLMHLFISTLLQSEMWDVALQLWIGFDHVTDVITAHSCLGASL